MAAFSSSKAVELVRCGHGWAGGNDYPLLTLAQTPLIETHLVASENPPSGAGEPGTPPVAPALANAWFALTGERLRSLPLG